MQRLGVTTKRKRETASVFSPFQKTFTWGRRGHITAEGGISFRNQITDYVQCIFSTTAMLWTLTPLQISVWLHHLNDVWSHGAIPDVPLLPDNDIKDGERLTIPSRRGAFEKRRKAEVTSFTYLFIILYMSWFYLPHYNLNVSLVSTYIYIFIASANIVCTQVWSTRYRCTRYGFMTGVASSTDMRRQNAWPISPVHQYTIDLSTTVTG